MPESVLPASVKFHYIKGHLFRVVHVDGAIGGITPQREIFVSVFSERAALPTMIEFGISPDGELGDELKREGKEGLVREMDIGMVLNEDAAQNLLELLQKQLQVLKESVPETPESAELARKTQ